MQARADSEFAAEAGADGMDGEEDGQENKPTGPAWEGSDRDYSYEELLGGSLSTCVLLISLSIRPSQWQHGTSQVFLEVLSTQSLYCGHVPCRPGI